MTDTPSTAPPKSEAMLAYEARVAEKIATNKRNFLVAFEKKACNIGAACKAANIDRQTYANYVKADPEFANKIWEAQEALVDFAESQQMKNIAEGSEQSLDRFLRAYGQTRGYGNKVDVRVSSEIIVGLPEGFGE